MRASEARRAALRSALESHPPSDPREAGYVARMLGLVDGEDDPFSRSSYTPGHFTASAFVLSPCRRQLLLILHSKLGLWLQPGGHFDSEDHSAELAARREVLEETAIRDLTPGLATGHFLDVDIHRIPPNPKRGEPAHEHFDLRFLFVAKSAEFRAGSDALEGRWVDLNAVKDAGTDDSVLRALRKIQQLK